MPPLPDEWSDDDVVHALSMVGADTSGDLIVGDAAPPLGIGNPTGHGSPNACTPRAG